jgi:hypothetical protein
MLSIPECRDSKWTWSLLEWGLWVGRQAGEFAGIIEQHHHGLGFDATDADGCVLGRFPTVTDAQGALTGASESPRGER